MPRYRFSVDGQEIELETEAQKPLLWVLREDLQLNQVKFSCGAGLCGSCSVYLDDQVVRSCVYPVSLAAGKSVRTVQGLNDSLAQDLKTAWAQCSVAQCGYCQPGFLLSAHKLLRKTPVNETFPYKELNNLCRCGSYDRIRLAIDKVAQKRAGDADA